MNIHLPAILGFTRYQGFDPSPYFLPVSFLFVYKKNGWSNHWFLEWRESPGDFPYLEEINTKMDSPKLQRKAGNSSAWGRSAETIEVGNVQNHGKPTQ